MRIENGGSIRYSLFSMLYLLSSFPFRFLDALEPVCYKNQTHARTKCNSLMYWSSAVALRG
jgi:hypothetical protein